MALCLSQGVAIAQTTTTTDPVENQDYKPKWSKESGRLVFKSVNTTSGPHYRIPSLIRVNANTLLAFCDNRPTDGADMGGNCKNTIVYKISTDNGSTWSEVKTAINSASGVAKGVGATEGGTNITCYASDVATVRDRESGKILLISTYGNQGIDGSSRTSPIRVVRQYLTPSTDGKTFTSESANEDITDQIYNLFPDVTGLFFSSGAMCQSRVVKTGNYYRIYAGLMTKDKGCKVVYSDDFGSNWKALNVNTDQPIPNGDECKVIELPDGNLVLSARSHVKQMTINGQTKDVHGRFFNIFTFTKGSTELGHWATAVLSNTDDSTGTSKEYELNAFGTGGYAQVNGSLAILPAQDKSGNRAYVLLQSLPARKGGTNGLAIYWKPLVGIGELEEPHYWGNTITTSTARGDGTFDVTADQTKWGVIGTPTALQRGWNKFKLYSQDTREDDNADDSRYSTMIDNGKDGIDMLSEETRVGFSNHILYRHYSLNTITGGEYFYYVDDTNKDGTISDDERKTYAQEYLDDNAIPLPGNTYTMRVRWKNPSTNEITEKYLYSDLTDFYDNSDEYQKPSVKLASKSSTDAPDGHYYWTIQSDPDIATKGNSGILQPYTYISIFNGEGYLGQRSGYNLSTGTTGTNVPGLSPETGKELRLLEYHHMQWTDRDDKAASKPTSTMYGYGIVMQKRLNGSRSLLCFDKNHDAINYQSYSTQWASNTGQDAEHGFDAEMASYSTNYLKLLGTTDVVWSTDVIFTKVRESTQKGYGTFARPEYEQASTGSNSGYRVTFGRSTEAWLKTKSDDNIYDDRNYWATLCLPYAVKLPTVDDNNQQITVKVYKVTGTNLITGTHPDQELQMTDITSQLNGTIPRETPVLLCVVNTQSTAPEILTVDFMPTDAQKPLKTGFTGNFGRTLFYDQVKGQSTYNKDTGRKNEIYYILAKGSSGRNTGRVALYQLGPDVFSIDGKDKEIYALAKNKAVFKLSASSPAAKFNSLSLSFDNAATGIKDVKTPRSQNETKIYTIGGQYLGEDLNSLSNGIYIVNGKKVLK